MSKKFCATSCTQVERRGRSKSVRLAMEEVHLTSLANLQREISFLMNTTSQTIGAVMFQKVQVCVFVLAQHGPRAARPGLPRLVQASLGIDSDGTATFAKA